MHTPAVISDASQNIESPRGPFELRQLWPASCTQARVEKHCWHLGTAFICVLQRRCILPALAPCAQQAALQLQVAAETLTTALPQNLVTMDLVPFATAKFSPV